jgi:hypothetical protein
MEVEVKKASGIAQPVKQILSYFVRNPSVADSLEGIAHWRLLEEAIHRNVAETEEALHWLVKEGYLIETSHSHSGRLFQFNPQKLSDAERLLQPLHELGKDEHKKN